jgi:hypothetical protein
MKDSDASTEASFNVHGLVGIDVDSGTPGEPELRGVLAPFLGGSRAPLRLRFSGSLSTVPEQSQANGQCRFTEDSLYLPAYRMQILANRHGYVIQGRGELLSALLPLLDSLCIRANVAMIHAVALDCRGSGVLLPASVGAVASRTAARLAAESGVRFMADDWAFLDGDGMLLGYPKPLVPGGREAIRLPGVLNRFPRPPGPDWLANSAARLAASAQPVFERYPAGGAFSRRGSFPGRAASPAHIFGPGRISSAALARLAIFLEPFDGRDARLAPRSAEWMTARVIGGFHSRLPTESRLLVEALGATGLVPLEDHFGRKAAVVSRALSEVPCYLLRVPAAWPAGRTSEYIAELVSSKLEE